MFYTRYWKDAVHNFERTWCINNVIVGECSEREDKCSEEYLFWEYFLLALVIDWFWVFITDTDYLYVYVTDIQNDIYLLL